MFQMLQTAVEREQVFIWPQSVQFAVLLVSNNVIMMQRNVNRLLMMLYTNAL